MLGCWPKMVVLRFFHIQRGLASSRYRPSRTKNREIFASLHMGSLRAAGGYSFDRAARECPTPVVG